MLTVELPAAAMKRFPAVAVRSIAPCMVEEYAMPVSITQTTIFAAPTAPAVQASPAWLP